jgi:hypothetical protein
MRETLPTRQGMPDAPRKTIAKDLRRNQLDADASADAPLSHSNTGFAM